MEFLPKIMENRRNNFRNGNKGNFRGGNRSGSFGNRNRRPLEKFDAICGKCEKKCQVPFKPSGEKPVLCSDCFEKEGNGNSRNGNRFGGRNSGGNRSSGVSFEQFKKLDEKVDKIISILEKQNT